MNNEQVNNKVKQYYNYVYYSKREKFKVERKVIPDSNYYGKFLDILHVAHRKRLLDIACGTGGLLLEAEERGLECYGVDISEVAISKARKRTNAQLVCETVENGLPYDNALFDYITCLGSLEHFHNKPVIIQEISRVAKDECKICILADNDNYILHKLGYESDGQPVLNRYSLKAYQTLLESNGLTILKTLKDNSHLMNLNQSSSYLKYFAKVIIHPFIRLLPLNLSFGFVFVCGKRMEKKSNWPCKILK